MLVVDMIGAAVVVMMVVVIVMMMGHGKRGLGALCLQRPHKAAALGPNQPGAERRDQRVAGDLDRFFGPAHGLRGSIEQPGADADQHHRDQRLQQRRGKRQQDAAPRGFLVGDKIRRDHRLAVAGAGGVKYAVGKRDRKQRPDRRAVGFRGADGRGHLAIEFRLLGQDPSDDAADLRFGGRPRPAERVLRHQGVHDAVSQQNHGKRSDGDDRKAREARAGIWLHGQSTVILLANIAP